ncbi:MAG TPA: phage portal protein [Actinomycetota bacterium]|nr:phage portal protein [Actinomycetota bacterium]
MQVPTIARGRNLICGTIGALPLRAYRTMSGMVSEVDPPAWAANPDPDYTRLWTFANTLDDLLFHARAYWRVRSRLAGGFPGSFEYLSLDRVGWSSRSSTPLPWGVPSERGPGYVLTVDGRPVPDQDVVRFDGIGGRGILTDGAREIRTALALSDAARRFAGMEIPVGVLRDTGAGLDPDEVTDLLAKWESARRSHTTAYTGPDLAYETEGSMDPAALQLVEGRQQSSVELARLLGLSPAYVGAPLGAGNMTYANLDAARRELVDTSLGWWISSLEQRLSMDDVTPRGTMLRLDVDALTRGTTTERWNAYSTAFAIVDETGARAMTVAEIRDREASTPPGTRLPDVPASPAELGPTSSRPATAAPSSAA